MSLMMDRNLSSEDQSPTTKATTDMCIHHATFQARTSVLVLKASPEFSVWFGVVSLCFIAQPEPCMLHQGTTRCCHLVFLSSLFEIHRRKVAMLLCLFPLGEGSCILHEDMITSEQPSKLLP